MWLDRTRNAHVGDIISNTDLKPFKSRNLKDIYHKKAYQILYLLILRYNTLPKHGTSHEIEKRDFIFYVFEEDGEGGGLYKLIYIFLIFLFLSITTLYHYIFCLFCDEDEDTYRLTYQATHRKVNLKWNIYFFSFCFSHIYALFLI